MWGGRNQLGINMKRTLFTIAIAIPVAGVAHAAEPFGGEPAFPPAPFVEPAPERFWAGSYIGADVGWGWADVNIDDNGFFNGGFTGRADGKDPSGPAGGIFAGWLTEQSNFLFGVEAFGQLAGIEGGGSKGFDRCANFQGAGEARVGCLSHRPTVDGLVGAEAVLGVGLGPAAFLLHAGPALGFFSHDGHGWFDQNDDGVVDSGERFRAINGSSTDLGLSLGAEGRWQATPQFFAGLIGRAFWFPSVGDDDFSEAHGPLKGFRSETDLSLFEVKARIGMTFSRP